MDKISHLIHDVMDNNKWNFLKFVKEGPKISHLMFVDDLILFGTASDSQINATLDILAKFYSASEQHINMEKINIFFSNNTPLSTRRHILVKSGFKETTSLGTYLGVPLSSNHPQDKYY